MKKQQPQDFIGKEFKHVIITDYVEYKNHYHFVTIQCKCGNNIGYKRYSDINNKTRCKNCRVKYTQNNDTKRLNRIYKNMKTRCYNANYKEWHNYGGKGIKICDEWLHDKFSFIKWSLENGYKDGLTIDRMDSNGDYSPKNCRWITKSLNSSLASQGQKYKLDTPILAISPNDEEHLIEYDIKRFCDHHGLDVSAARKVAKGKYAQHKGWKFKYIQ